MRKLFAVSCLAILALSTIDAQASDAKPSLKLTEGYFQNGEASMPLNLLKSTEARGVRRGDPVRIWLDAEAIAPSPCDKKSEKPCKTLWLLKSGKKVLQELRGEMRWDWESKPKDEYVNMISWEIGGWEIPRSVDDGPMTMSFAVSKDGKTLFSTEVHFEIK